MNQQPILSRVSLSTMKTVFAVASAAALFAGCASLKSESDFISLFDGQSLNGWTLKGGHGAGYGVTNGVIY